MKKRFKCPRRAELPSTSRFATDKQNPDRWEKRHGLSTQLQEQSCSYCGSLNPDRFMELVEADGEVGPTDKNYKAYLRWDGGEAKFYYQHLSPEQMIRFVELLNQKKLKIGYPGRFYVIPYFITLKNQEPPSDG